MNSKSKGMIQKISDFTDKYFIKHDLFDLPMRLLLIGKSQLSGKSTLMINLIAQDWGYKNIFKPENIYIVSPSIKTEKFRKFISYMEIPEENLFNEYDEENLNTLYELLKTDHESNEEKEHKLIILDDVAYSGKLSSSGSKSENIMDKLFSNSRHQLISIIVIAQKYTQLSTCMRENCTGIIMWECTNTQLEKIEEEHNSATSKKEFIKAFKGATSVKHSFFTINYKFDPKERFYKGLTEIINFDE